MERLQHTLSDSGIYKIESTINGKIYVGSAICIKERWRKHREQLKSNRHDNGRLQNHVNKYGLNDLKFSVLVFYAKEKLIEKEQYYIDTWNPFFNICKIAGSCLGVKHSDSFKLEKSIFFTGNKYREGSITSEETKKKQSIAHKKLIRTEEHKKNISKGKKGKPSNRKGATQTESTKQKMSKAKEGHLTAQETRDKISKTKTGVKLTEEQKAKRNLTIKINKEKKNENKQSGFTECS